MSIHVITLDEILKKYPGKLSFAQVVAITESTRAGALLRTHVGWRDVLVVTSKITNRFQREGAEHALLSAGFVASSWHGQGEMMRLRIPWT